MTGKRYTELDDPLKCPNREPYCNADKGGAKRVYICEIEYRVCASEYTFPPWCPLKKVEE